MRYLSLLLFVVFPLNLGAPAHALIQEAYAPELMNSNAFQRAAVRQEEARVRTGAARGVEWVNRSVGGLLLALHQIGSK